MKQLLFILPIFFVVLKIPAQGIKKTTKPNVIFIAIDDLKPTIGAFGDEFAKTPVLDKVGQKWDYLHKQSYTTSCLWAL